MSRRYVVLALIALTVGIGTFLHTVFYSDGWGNRERARIDLEALVSENGINEKRVAGLRRQIEAIRERREVQERVVRHELGYIRPAEEIVIELGSKPQ